MLRRCYYAKVPNFNAVILTKATKDLLKFEQRLMKGNTY